MLCLRQPNLGFCHLPPKVLTPGEERSQRSAHLQAPQEVARVVFSRPPRQDVPCNFYDHGNKSCSPKRGCWSHCRQYCSLRQLRPSDSDALTWRRRGKELLLPAPPTGTCPTAQRQETGLGTGAGVAAAAGPRSRIPLFWCVSEASSSWACDAATQILFFSALSLSGLPTVAPSLQGDETSTPEGRMLTLGAPPPSAVGGLPIAV